MKKILKITVPVLMLLAVLFLPIPKGPYEDGGTKEYRALTYKVVKWNRLYDDGVFAEARIYWFPDNFKDIDTLFYTYEESKLVSSFTAKIIELDGSSALVEPAEGEWERNSADRIYVSIRDFEDIGANEGDLVEIFYDGYIMESYPAQIHGTGWKRAN